MVFRKKKDSGRRHHDSNNNDWNAREERKRAKMRASASGDVGLELLGMNRKNNLQRNRSTTDDEPLDPFPTIGRGLSSMSFGSMMSFDQPDELNHSSNKKSSKKKKQQPQQQQIQMWDAAAVAKKKKYATEKVHEPQKEGKAKTKKSKQLHTSKKPAKDQVDDDFDLEPTILKRLNQASKQQSVRSLQSQELDAHNHSGHPSHGFHDDVHKPSKKNHLLGLVDHGDWQDIENKLLQSNHRKFRKNTSPDECDSASVSSSSESSIGDSSHADSSSDESHVSSSSSSQSAKTNDELSEEESRNKKQITDHEHETKLRRKIARMRSAELRRWNGFKPQVQQLLERCNMPHDSAHVDNLLEQFENREAELLASLQSMAAKVPRQNRANIHKSRHFEHRIASYMSYGTAEALAHIAAASTLDENPIAVKPEYVVDKPVEHSESEECSDSYYDDDDDDDDDYDDEHEDSYESESGSEEHDNYDDEEDYDGASQDDSQTNPSQSDEESVESNEISLEETENLTVQEDIHRQAGNFMLGSGNAFSEQEQSDDDSFFDRSRDQQSDSSGGSFSRSREGSQADWSYSGHDDEDAFQQLRSNVRGNRFGYG